MLNPTIQDYINDLLAENKSNFAFIHAVLERIKNLKRDLFISIDNAKTDNDIKNIACLVGRIIGLTQIKKGIDRDIKNNLEKIRGLRDGTIKEI